MADSNITFFTDTPLQELGLSTRSYKALRLRFNSVEEMCMKTSSNKQHPNCLMTIRNLSEKSADKIAEEVRKRGFDFADQMQYKAWEEYLKQPDALPTPNNDGITLATHVELLDISPTAIDRLLKKGIYTVGSLCERTTLTSDPNSIRSLFPTIENGLEYKEKADEIISVIHKCGFYFSNEILPKIEELDEAIILLKKAVINRSVIIEGLEKIKSLTEKKQDLIVEKEELNGRIAELIKDPRTRAMLKRLLESAENGKRRKLTREP